MERAGTAMLEDGVFAQGSWLKDAKNQDIAKRFLARLVPAAERRAGLEHDVDVLRRDWYGSTPSP